MGHSGAGVFPKHHTIVLSRCDLRFAGVRYYAEGHILELSAVDGGDVGACLPKDDYRAGWQQEGPRVESIGHV